MNADRYTRAKQLFLAACELDDAEREAYLAKACGGDTNLRADVESMLGFHRVGEPTERLGPVAPEPTAPGTLAERYEVVGELGRGGMGRVYQAVDLRFRRTVAVKELAVTSREAHDAFEREARLLNGLRFKGLPVVTDYFDEGDRFFLVMDFVGGRDLKAMMTERLAAGEGPFPPGLVLGWADRLLEVLGYLGSFSPPIVHRDIKPQNLKITPEGEIVLLDFGLAKGSVGPPSGRLTSVVGFTPNYAPLEQVRGGGTDPRSDLFSLGVTLLYLMTGRMVPNSVERAEAVVSGHADPAVAWLRRASQVPRAVAAVLGRAIELRREDRPATAAALRAALAAARGDDSVPADAETTATTRTFDEEDEAAGQATNPMTELRPNNLPQQVTGFVGREREIDVVLALVRASRLVTLSGPGGIGKTRLALRVASDLLEDYPDGVWLVDLATAPEPDHVARAVAEAVSVRERPGEPLADALVDALRARSALLLLDNCEHVVGESAALVDRLLRACPRLRVLATSRERLGLRGEAVHPVGPMALPEEADGATEAGANEAARLFVARARLLRPSFHLDDENVATVTAICRRLDGIPLAIELAAGRIGVLTVEQILARLDDRFRLLAGADRAAPARQQTLRGAVDWSYELLGDAERATLARIAVFPSSFSLEGAEAVAAAFDRDVDVLEALSRLVDKSFVTAEAVGSETRYRMLETIRAYALDKLAARGEERAAHVALVAWARDLARTSARELTAGRQPEWLTRLDAEHENLRAALAVAAAEPSLALAGLDTATSLVRFWHLRGHVREARSWLARFLELSPDAPAEMLGEAHRSAGILANMKGEFEAARDHCERALAIARAAGDDRTTASALANLAITLRDIGELEGAAALAAESLELFRRLGDRPMISLALLNLGAIEQDRGAYERASACFEETLKIKRALGDRFGVANALTNLAGGAVALGDLDRADVLLAEALPIRRSLGEPRGLAQTLTVLATVDLKRGRLAECGRSLREALELRDELGDRQGMLDVFEALVGLYAARGEWERALVFAGVAEAARERLGAPTMPKDVADVAAAVARAREAVGDEAAEAALDQGRALPLERSAVDDA